MDQLKLSGPAPVGKREQFTTLWARTRLFWVSYAPLAAIFAARAYAANKTVQAIVWSIVTVVGLVLGWTLLSGIPHRDVRNVTLQNVHDSGGVVAGYLASYLLPFVTAAPANVGDLLAYIIYFGVLYVVFVRSDLAMINPTLYLLGWRIASATAGERSVLVLCRDLPKSGDSIEVAGYLDVYVVTRTNG
jgi:hypothetical protein